MIGTGQVMIVHRRGHKSAQDDPIYGDERAVADPLVGRICRQEARTRHVGTVDEPVAQQFAIRRVVPGGVEVTDRENPPPRGQFREVVGQDAHVVEPAVLLAPPQRCGRVDGEDLRAGRTR